jgi:hypothetical protein
LSVEAANPMVSNARENSAKLLQKICLQGVNKKKRISFLEMVDDELKNMPITTLDQVNDIAYATACVITRELDFKLEHRQRNEPPLKIRIKRKIEKMTISEPN